MHSGVSCLPGDVQLPKPCGSGILADQFDGLFALGELGMALNVMQKADLSRAPREAHGKITKQSVNLDKVTATRVTFHPGAKWSRDLKAYAGTHSCALPHVAMVLQGTLRVVMDDGSKEDFSAGEMMLLPPGHDAWCVGKTACIFVEFSQGNNYYNQLVTEWHHQNA